MEQLLKDAPYRGPKEDVQDIFRSHSPETLQQLAAQISGLVAEYGQRQGASEPPRAFMDSSRDRNQGSVCPLPWADSEKCNSCTKIRRCG